MPVCLLSLLSTHGVHPYEKCDYKRERERERESAVPQLAWHLAWHIAALPRPLPARSNVAVDKPIKKPLLNALTPSASLLSHSLLLVHALRHRPRGWGGGGRQHHGGEGEETGSETERKGGRLRSVCLRDFTSRFDDKNLFGQKKW